MKIVIDITEEIYKDICDNGYIFDEDSEDIAKAIKNGTSVEPEITNDDLQAAMTESYHLGYELAETKFKRPQGKWLTTKAYPRKVYCSECTIMGVLFFIVFVVATRNRKEDGSATIKKNIENRTNLC